MYGFGQLFQFNVGIAVANAALMEAFTVLLMMYHDVDNLVLKFRVVGEELGDLIDLSHFLPRLGILAPERRACESEAATACLVG